MPSGEVPTRASGTSKVVQRPLSSRKPGEGVRGALLGLLGALQRVALLTKQPPHGVIRDLKSLRAKRVGKLPGGLGGPAQRRLRVATRVRVDQGVQRGQQARLALCQPLGPTTGAAHPAVRVGRVVQFVHAGVHRRAGQSPDAGHARAAAVARRPGGRAGQRAALLSVRWGRSGRTVRPVRRPRPRWGPYRRGIPPRQLSDNSRAGTLTEWPVSRTPRSYASKPRRGHRPKRERKR
jgi:hypothetical protein